jgi:hypothetical protein
VLYGLFNILDLNVELLNIRNLLAHLFN